MNNHKKRGRNHEYHHSYITWYTQRASKRVAPLKSGLFPSTNIFVVLTLGDKSPPFSRCSASYARQGNQK
ncbi:Uncharacterised protein [Escherichia coli]|nr:Uncharacterised protein [Escherichia coli]